MVAYSSGESVVLPLQELMDVLQFPIRVDVEGAKGWFIQEQKTFLLDTERREVTINGKRTRYPEARVEIIDDELYVDLELLQHWFPLVMDYSLAAQSLTITSKEKLPMELALDRQTSRRMGSEKEKPDYPFMMVPYQWISSPFMDVDISSDYDTQRSDPLNLTFNTLTSMEFLQLGTHMFMSGNSTRGLSDIRVRAERKDPYGELFGILNATELSLGDIATDELSLSTENTQGRGVLLSNFPLHRVSAFDQITLRGDLLPGWEVELYRNGVLLNFQDASADGQYEFFNVPLLTGENIIRLVFYGPFGEQREETKRYFIGKDLVTQGQSHYSLAVTQHERDVFQVNEPPDAQGLEGKTRVIAEYEYGLGERLTYHGHFTSLPLEDNKHHHYLTNGLSTTLGNSFWRTDMSHDAEDGGYAVSVNMQTRWQHFSVSTRYERFVDYVSEKTDTITDPVTRRVSLLLDGQVKVPALPTASTGLVLEREWFDSGRKETNISHRISMHVGVASFSHSLQLQQSESAGDTDRQLDGDLLISSRLERLGIRGGIGYDIYPTLQIDQLNLSADYDIARDYRGQLGLAHELSGDGITRITAGVSSMFEHYRLGLEGEYEDDGEARIGIMLSFSLGKMPEQTGYAIYPEPMASEGMLASRIFVDRNGDHQFDPGDEPLEHAGLRINRGSSREATNEGGMVFVLHLEPYEPSDVSVDMQTIEDPYLVPYQPGVRMVPRPSVPGQVEFALLPTGEIDGVVYLNKAGTNKDVSNVQVELVNQDGEMVQEARSAFDGFYLFDKVPPGDYNVRVSAAQAERLGLVVPEAQKVTIGYDSTIISGLNMVLKKETRNKGSPD